MSKAPASCEAGLGGELTKKFTVLPFCHFCHKSMLQGSYLDNVNRYDVHFFCTSCAMIFYTLLHFTVIHSDGYERFGRLEHFKKALTLTLSRFATNRCCRARTSIMQAGKMFIFFASDPLWYLSHFCILQWSIWTVFEERGGGNWQIDITVWP